MSRQLSYLSVCSGIEAATVAWHPLGFHPVGFAEIEAFPSALLAHHYPAVANLGDMTRFKEWRHAAFNVLVGGTPCQSFSVAGLRKGLADPRGNLALTYLAIADHGRPDWLVWENVPGVLSSWSGDEPPGDLVEGQRWESTETSDFGSFIAGLQQLGYGVAWRVLDAQYVRVDGFLRAVPQRRRRVIVVGHSSGDWRRAAAVLFDAESLRGNPPPGRQSGERTAGALAASAGRRGGVVEGERSGLIPEVANPLTARMVKGVNTTMDEGQTMVAHAFKASHFTRGKDGSLQPTAPALSADADKGDQDTLVLAPGVAPPLNAGGNETGGVRQPCPAADTAAGLIPVVVRGDAATLTRGAESAGKGGYAGRRQEDDVNLVAAVAFHENQRGEITVNDTAGSLKIGGGKPGQGYPAVAVAYDGRGREGGIQFEGPHETANIRAASGGSSRSYVAEQWAVRRLTPTECERLQGFPDGYTAIRHRGAMAADGPRYKALGNSMAVNVMRWIGQRILMVDRIK